MGTIEGQSRPTRMKTEDRKFQAAYSESKFLVITTAGYVKRLQEAAKKRKRPASGPQDEKIEAAH